MTAGSKTTPIDARPNSMKNEITKALARADQRRLVTSAITLTISGGSRRVIRGPHPSSLMSVVVVHVSTPSAVSLHRVAMGKKIRTTPASTMSTGGRARRTKPGTS